MPDRRCQIEQDLGLAEEEQQGHAEPGGVAGVAGASELEAPEPDVADQDLDDQPAS